MNIREFRALTDVAFRAQGFVERRLVGQKVWSLPDRPLTPGPDGIATHQHHVPPQQQARQKTSYFPNRREIALSYSALAALSRAPL